MNFKFNKSIPSILACIVAFIITLIIKSILPSSKTELAGNDLPLPDIPFQEKDKKKEKDHFVLIALRDIKQYEKVSAQAVTWKKWPKDAISVQFIAKDADGNMLNSNLSYSNVINLYTKYPITKGTPITMNVLSRKRNDKAKKSKMSAIEKAIRQEVETKVRNELSKDFDKKLADEKATMKKNSLDASRNSVTSGMSVISVPIDQRSITSKEFLRIGDRVDLLFSANKKSGSFIKFRNVKLLEIDGKTDIVEKIQDTPPKSITVEISSNHAEDLLKQVGSGKSAVIIVKNQKDITREELGRNHVYDIITGRNLDKRREKFLLDEALKVTNNRTYDTKNSLERFAKTAFSSKSNEAKKKNIIPTNESALQDIAAKGFNAKATEKSTADSWNGNKLLNLALRGFSTHTQNKPPQNANPDSKSSATNGIIQKLFTALGEKAEKPTERSNVISKIAENGFNAKRFKDERNHDLYKYAQTGFQSVGTDKNAKANDNERIIELNKYIENGFKSEATPNPQMIYTNLVNKTFKKQSKNNDYRPATEKLKDKGGIITISRKNASQSVQYDGSGRIVDNKNKQSSAPALNATPAIDSLASNSSVLSDTDSIDTNIDAAAILNSIKNGGI